MPSSPTSTAAYLYDGEGNRVEQQTTQGGTTTTTIYVGGLEEITATGTTTTTTYYGGLALAVNGVLSYLVADGVGSLTEAVDTNGNVEASQLYAPYGRLRYSSGTMPTSYGFTGQRQDALTGLDYFNARYYDPQAGQFISADTVLPGGGYDPWGLSRYAYVAGNPVVFTDPSGHRFAACDAENPGSPCSTGGVGGGDPSGTGGIGGGNGNGDGTDTSFTPPPPPGIPAGDVPPIAGGAGFENFEELPVGMPETIQEPDGTTETVTNEGGGNVEIEFSDGVTVQEHADGSSETIEPDGEVIEQTGDVATEQDAVEAPKPTEPEENNSTNDENGNNNSNNNNENSRTTTQDYYRGAKPGTQPTFEPGPKDLRDNPDGTVKPGFGPSVFDDPAAPGAPKGFDWYKLPSGTPLPDELDIIQRGMNLHHFEVVTTAAIAREMAIALMQSLDQFLQKP
jgi:RHS repeat-associated protein